MSLFNFIPTFYKSLTVGIITHGYPVSIHKADDLALAGDNQGGAETVAVEQRLTPQAPQSQVW